MHQLSSYAVRHPRGIIRGSLLLTVVLAALALLPSFWPAMPALNPIMTDTDPENMLAEDAPVRVDHQRLKDEFGLEDYVVVAVVNPSHPEGVFNPTDLAQVHQLTQSAKSLRFTITTPEGQETARVVSEDIIAPSEVDNIETEALGAVRFNYLMPQPPQTQAEATRIRKQALSIPFYRGTLVSEDGQALGLYFPITDKKIAHSVEQALRETIAGFEPTGAEYHITGLPVAEDRFGAEMFFQMAVSAPMALLCVFLLLYYFFRNVPLVLVSLTTAIISVTLTMSLLVISGFTIHIMSSMIPIFIIPIAILDDIHILSEFHDRYRPGRNRQAVIHGVMDELWRPMFFTSITTAAGFASLVLTPNPPVQVFGAFIALGVLIAWLVTVTLRPAFLAWVSDDTLARFGMTGHPEAGPSEATAGRQTPLARLLHGLGEQAGSRWPLVLVVSLGLLVFSAVGISRIQVNDNPIRWFEPEHEIRQATEVMNAHLAGSYMAYLSLDASRAETGSEPFKDPELLRYIADLQAHLETHPDIGKVAALPDIVKTVHRELLDSKEAFRIPDSRRAVAQTLLTFENSHNPDDLWNLVTPDYSRANLWLQLQSGDNRDMQSVVAFVEDYLEANPPPQALEKTWFGLTYINLVWQEKMVVGMLEALAGSFVVVALLMVLLFRSLGWGLLTMVPLTVTITVIYGLVGWLGKDYDMPTAVLSSLSLGLAVDYAIHFNARSRQAHQRLKDWPKAREQMFGEPARAISRNVIVLGIGFLPLLASSLVPYQTVGILISSILVLAGAATLVLLPALITALQKYLFNGRSIS